MANNTIEVTVKQASKAMLKGLSISKIRQIMLEDGFLPSQVNVMVRWAIQMSNEVVVKQSKFAPARYK
jgi:hypothetical protein